MKKEVSYLYVLKYPKEIRPEIEERKDKENKELNFEPILKLEDQKKKLDDTLNEKNKFKIKDIQTKIKASERVQFASLQQGILKSYKNCYFFSPYSIHDIYGLKIKELSKDGKNIPIEIGKKYKKLGSTMLGEKIYKEIQKYDYCKRNELTLKVRIGILYRLYDLLELGGTFYTSILTICDIDEIEYVYLLSLLFDTIIMIDKYHIQCYQYLGEERITKRDFKEKMYKPFHIHPKPHIHSLLNYVENLSEYQFDMYKLLIKGKYKKYEEKSLEYILGSYMEVSVDNPSIKVVENNFLRDYQIQLNTSLIVDLILSKKKDTVKELKNILNLIKIRYVGYRYLQIGMSYGAFSKIILENSNSNSFLHILDKDQKLIWDNQGIQYLHDNGFKNFECIYEDSFVYMPQILKDFHPLSFSLIFIEKPFTFDIMMNFMVYIQLLLSRFGFLVFDKMININMFKVYEYIDKNYKHFERIPNKHGIVIYRKIDEHPQSEYEFV